MKISSFAPHLAGRMLPALFSECPELRKPRFPGDPWATQPHWAAWYWMHSTTCTRDERGCLHGLCRAWSIPVALRDQLTPEGPDARVREHPGQASPRVGAMGARQPADAGPPVRQRELFAEAT